MQRQSGAKLVELAGEKKWCVGVSLVDRVQYWSFHCGFFFFTAWLTAGDGYTFKIPQKTVTIFKSTVAPTNSHIDWWHQCWRTFLCLYIRKCDIRLISRRGAKLRTFDCLWLRLVFCFLFVFFVRPVLLSDSSHTGYECVLWQINS